MPEIKQYDLTPSDVGGPLQARRLTPGEIETSSGDQALAQGLGEVGQVAHQQDVQQKRAAAAADLAVINARLTAQHAQSEVNLQDALKNSPNGDPQIVQNTLDAHDQAMPDIEQDIKTPVGRQYFQKREAQIRGSLLVSAAQGQSQLAGKAASDSVVQAISSASVAVQNNPTKFAEQLEAFQSYTDASVKYAGLSAVHKTELDNKAGKELAEHAVEGWIATGSPAPGPNDINGAKVAEEKLKSGEYDKYLSGDEKVFLMSKVQQAYRAQEAEQARQEKEAKRAKDAKDEITSQGFLQDLTDHKLTAPQVLNSDLYETDKEHWLHMIKADATTGWHSDKQVVSDLMRRMDLPPGDPNRITSQQQIMKYVGTEDTGNINMADAAKLTKYYEKGTPQREADAKSWQDFRNSTWAAIAKPDPVTKLPSSPELGVQADHVRQQLRDAELNYRQKGITAAEALNPKDPNYVGKTVHFAPPSMMDRIDSMVKSITGGNQPQPTTPNAPVQQGGAPYASAPKVGEVRGGYRFNGGNARDKNSWSKE